MVRCTRWGLLGLWLAACGVEPATAEQASATEGGEPAPPATEPTEPTEPVPDAEPIAQASAEPEPEPLGRCHVSCCSPRVLELQAQSSDPSIQNECCFCDD